MVPFTIGLTGGIASGKTLVAERFEALGIPVLDADQVSREVVAPPSPALDRIAQEFGSEFIDAQGQLDRRRMREHVFAQPEARKRLEAILHPLIRARLRDWRDAQTAPYCMLSVAILLESGMRTLVNRVLVIDAQVEAQMDRLVRRDGVSVQLATNMIAAQATRETRLRAADDVIDNSGDLDNTYRQIAALHRHYLEMAAASQSILR